MGKQQSAPKETAPKKSALAPGQHLFICVSKQWREANDNAIAELYPLRLSCSGFEWTSNMTSFSAAFANVSTIRLAYDCGLQLNRPDQTYIPWFASEVADIEVLAVAHELGMPYSENLLYGLASLACFPVLHWLYAEQKCPLPKYIDTRAAESGCVTTLRWLKAVGVSFTADTVTHAARYRRLPALQYLYEQSCSL
jgi:hypothetical protein